MVRTEKGMAPGKVLPAGQLVPNVISACVEGGIAPGVGVDDSQGYVPATGEDTGILKMMKNTTERLANIEAYLGIRDPIRVILSQGDQ